MIKIDCRDLAAHVRSLEGTLFAEVLNASSDWVFIKDTDSRFLYSNAAHLAHLNATEAQLLGKNDLELYPPELSEVFYADETRLFSNRIPLVKVERNRSRRGEPIITIITKQVVCDANDNVLGLMGMGRLLTMDDSVSFESARERVLEVLDRDVAPQVTRSQMLALKASVDSVLRPPGSAARPA